ncbi:MAG: ABC transporter ATP-binding protein [Thermoleophilia bacterium]
MIPSMCADDRQTEDRGAGANAGLRARLLGAFGRLLHLPWALRLVWSAARRWTIAWLLLILGQGLVPVGVVFLVRSVVNGVVAAVEAGGGWVDVRPVVLLAAALGGLLVAGEGLRGLAGWVRAAQGELVRDHIAGLIHHRSVELDLAYYETPEYHDHLHRAQGEALHRPLALVEGLGTLLQNSVTFVAMLAVLVPYGWWLTFVLLASTVPALLVVLRHSSAQHAWRRRTTADERRTWYYSYLLTRADAAMEVRLFDLGARLMSRYDELRSRLRVERLSLARRQGLAAAGAGVFGLAVAGAAMAWMVWRTARGGASLGDLALFYQAFQQGQRLLRAVLEGVGQLLGNALFLGDLREFMNLEPRVVDPPPGAGSAPAHGVGGGRLPTGPPGVRLIGVTFAYPGSARRVLDDFSFAVPSGGIVALMGPNGSGKSTIFKLIGRLYDPQQGTVEIGGLDVRSLPLADLRSRITILAQRPVQYSMTVADNIALGRWAGDRAGGASDEDRESVTRAADTAGVDELIRELPQGYETLLGRWFDGGVELSVGEWQRVALARAFARSAPVMLLDEPTSAMDPWAEAEWMACLREMAEGRTVLLVTHRLSTAMHADVVQVLVDGRIVESGPHAELLTAGGEYARSWTAQRGTIC